MFFYLFISCTYYITRYTRSLLKTVCILKQAILIFPSANAEDAQEFMERNKREHDGKFPFDRVIFIDSTWNQTNRISGDSRIAGQYSNCAIHQKIHTKESAWKTYSEVLIVNYYFLLRTAQSQTFRN